MRKMEYKYTYCVGDWRGIEIGGRVASLLWLQKLLRLLVSGLSGAYRAFFVAKNVKSFRLFTRREEFKVLRLCRV